MKIASTILIVLIIALVVISSLTFVVYEGEYGIVKQFGKVVKICSEPGLYFKAPFIQSVSTLPQKVLLYDVPTSEVITKDKQTMVADCFALYKITDPQKFIEQLNGSLITANARIDVAVYNAMKTVMSSRTQAEIINDRQGKLAADITSLAQPNFPQYGIELMAIETKHLDLPYDNKNAVYNRMISERENTSAGYLAKGEKAAKDIRSETDKEVSILLADAKAKAEQLIAEGEAKYMNILSSAYDTKSKADFYEFVRALDAAKASLANGENVLVLDKNSPLVDIFYRSGVLASP